jgi:hypothetical protein
MAQQWEKWNQAGSAGRKGGGKWLPQKQAVKAQRRYLACDTAQCCGYVYEDRVSSEPNCRLCGACFAAPQAAPGGTGKAKLAPWHKAPVQPPIARATVAAATETEVVLATIKAILAGMQASGESPATIMQNMVNEAVAKNQPAVAPVVALTGQAKVDDLVKQQHKAAHQMLMSGQEMVKAEKHAVLLREQLAQAEADRDAKIAHNKEQTDEHTKITAAYSAAIQEAAELAKKPKEEPVAPATAIAQPPEGPEEEPQDMELDEEANELNARLSPKDQETLRRVANSTSVDYRKRKQRDQPQPGDAEAYEKVAKQVGEAMAATSATRSQG